MPDNPNDNKVFEVKNLVIHGNLPRARQLGYGYGPTYTKAGFQENQFINDQASTGIPVADNPLPQAGVVDINGEASSEEARSIQSLLSTITGETSIGKTHFKGNPAICMWLKLDKFFRTPDSFIGFTFETVRIRKFPMRNSLSNEWGWNWDPDPSFIPIEGIDTTAFPNEPFSWSNGGVSGTINPADYLEEYNDFNVLEEPWCRFKDHPVDISYSLFAKSNDNNSRELVKGSIYSFTSSSGHWSDTEFQIVKPLQVSAQLQIPGDEAVILGIFIKSNCSCDQTGVRRLVFATDITSYIPPVDPYFWRKFGTLEEEQALATKNGTTLSEDYQKLCDNKWHLVRPYYFMNNSKTWGNVEDLDPDKD